MCYLDLIVPVDFLS